MKWISLVIFSLCLSFVSVPAMSFNLDFLHDTATAKFNSEDWKMLNAATDKALLLPNGKKAVWRNPDTGHEGFVMPLDKFEEKGNTCRKLRIFNRTHHLKDHYVFTFCKYNTGWKILR